jgi:hypothetical protein
MKKIHWLALFFVLALQIGIILAIGCEKKYECPDCKTYTLVNGHVRSSIRTDSCQYTEGIVEVLNDSITFVTICHE